MSERDKRYIEKLQAHLVTAESKKRYSIERFDILIISLSSGGLVLSSGFFKDFPYTDKSLLELAWIFFSLALITNLSSQGTGYYANKNDIDCTRQIIEEIEGVLDNDNREAYDKAKAKYTLWTNNLNKISFLFLTVAIILLIFFITISL